MSEPSGRHKVETSLVLKRGYDAPLERVWRAWTDANELGKWYVAGDDHVVHFCEADVRVGGKYRVGFGPKGATPYVETGTYTEVVALKRLAFEETISFEGKHVHTNATIVDFSESHGRTLVTITSIGFESWRTGEGWTPALESLARYLGEKSP